MSRSNFAAIDWMRSVIEAQRLERERLSFICDHERLPEYDPPSSGGLVSVVKFGPACWKTTYQPTSERRDYETGEPLDMGWVPTRPRSEWCASCVARQAVHEALQKEKRKRGVRLRSMKLSLRADIRALDKNQPGPAQAQQADHQARPSLPAAPPQTKETRP